MNRDHNPIRECLAVKTVLTSTSRTPNRPSTDASRSWKDSSAGNPRPLLPLNSQCVSRRARDSAEQNLLLGAQLNVVATSSAVSTPLKLNSR